MHPISLKFIKYPIAKALEPTEGPNNVMFNRWWAVEDDCLLFYAPTKSPQCNVNKSIVERHNREIRFIERVFIPITWEGDYDI